MGYPEIRLALMEIDDEKLTIDDLKAISKQLPTPEEVYFQLSQFDSCVEQIFQVERIKSFDDINKLAKADQYFYQVCFVH